MSKNEHNRSQIIVFWSCIAWHVPFDCLIAKEGNAGNERVTVSKVDEPKTGISDACTTSVSIPQLEFHVLLKQGIFL